MEKVINFLKTDNGKLVGAVAGIILLIIFVAVATPNSINVIVNNGEDSVFALKSAKKTVKRKRAKAKKAKKEKKN